jgi:hypothetical protein
MASIANQYGLVDADTIYQDPANAVLRGKRPNLNVLREGDKVTVPDLKARTVNAGSDQSHRFKMRRPKVELVIKLLSERNTPLAGTKCSLVIDGDGTTLTSDGGGVIRIPINPELQAAKLYVWAEPGPIPSDAFALEIGSLPPADDVDGAQSRLTNLGFFCGEADGIVGPRTRHAVKAFQLQQQVTITGELDADMRNVLESAHGC